MFHDFFQVIACIRRWSLFKVGDDLKNCGCDERRGRRMGLLLAWQGAPWLNGQQTCGGKQFCNWAMRCQRWNVLFGARCSDACEMIMALSSTALITIQPLIAKQFIVLIKCIGMHKLSKSSIRSGSKRLTTNWLIMSVPAEQYFLCGHLLVRSEWCPYNKAFLHILPNKICIRLNDTNRSLSCWLHSHFIQFYNIYIEKLLPISVYWSVFSRDIRGGHSPIVCNFVAVLYPLHAVAVYLSSFIALDRFFQWVMADLTQQFSLRLVSSRP